MKREKSPYWIHHWEIMEVMQCGATLATRYLKQVNEDLKQKGMFVPPRGRTSRKAFMKYFNLE